MDTNNHGTDAPNDEENFAEMFEKSLKKQGKLEPGQMVEAAIVKVSPEWVFLDLGGKGEGYLDKKELQDENGTVSVKEGDIIRAYFVSSQNNEMHFTTKIGSGPGKQSQIEDAYRNRIPVEGTLVERDERRIRGQDRRQRPCLLSFFTDRFPARREPGRVHRQIVVLHGHRVRRERQEHRPVPQADP